MLYSVDKLSFSYGSKPVLNDLCLDIEPGLFHGILGPNGSGKTTFLDILVRHLAPSSGVIRFMDKPLDCYTQKDLARHVALVAQNPVIHFPYQVRDLVMMGRHPYIGRFSSPSDMDYQVVDQVADQADIRGFMDSPVTELSGGERQRVMFARALAQETPVLILDEATSNLDINHSLSLLNRVREGALTKGKTVIAVFQDINLASLFCDSLIFMKKGAVHAQGKVSEMLDRQVIREVYDVDSHVVDMEFSGTKQVVFRRSGR